MYFKVALFLVLIFLFSGCSSKPSPKPQAPQESNKTVVVEQNTTFVPVEEVNVTVKPKVDKYNFKPEPFSLNSNEDDPELLGPQTTLNRDTLSKKDDKSSKKGSEPKKSASSDKTIKKAKKEDESKS